MQVLSDTPSPERLQHIKMMWSAYGRFNALQQAYEVVDFEAFTLEDRYCIYTLINVLKFVF
jgi:hypothetical protein